MGRTWVVIGIAVLLAAGAVSTEPPRRVVLPAGEELATNPGFEEGEGQPAAYVNRGLTGLAPDTEIEVTAWLCRTSRGRSLRGSGCRWRRCRTRCARGWPRPGAATRRTPRSGP